MWKFFLLACIASFASTINARLLSVSLRAKWNGTSCLSEASEFLADQSSSLFWSLVDRTSAGTEPWGTAQKPEACWDAILEAAGQGLSVSEQLVLQLSLSARQHSPRAELYRRLASEAAGPQGAPPSCCFAEVLGAKSAGDRIVRDVSKLEGALAKAAGITPSEVDAVLEAGHAHPASPPPTDAAAATAVLYAPLGATCTAAWHGRLAGLAASGLPGGRKVRYILRPALSDASCLPAGGCGAYGLSLPVSLPGFGVEAVLKNMEYSARDEDAGKGGHAAAEAEDVPDDELEGDINGFLFGVLARRRPALRPALASFRAALLAELDAGSDSAMKVWELKDLGLQAAQQIVLGASDPLAALASVSQEFPALAPTLSKVEVSDEVREQAASLQGLASGLGDRALLSINGLAFDHMRPTLEVHRLIPRLQHEVALAQQLKGLGLDTSDTLELASLRAHAGSDSLGGRFAGGFEEQNSVSESMSDMAYEDEDEPALQTSEKTTYGTRLDVLELSDTPAAPFFNDLESDAEYRSYPFRSLEDFLRPQLMMYMAKPVARNTFHLHVFVDPATPEGLAAAAGIHELLEGRFPTRFALGLVGSAGDVGREWKDMTTSGRVARSYYALSSLAGPKAGLRFISALAWNGVDKELLEMQQMQLDSAHFAESAASLSDRRLSDAFKAAFKAGRPSQAKKADEAWEQVLKGTLEAEDKVSSAQSLSRSFVTGKGLSLPLTALLNGKLIPMEGVSDTESFFQAAIGPQDKELRQLSKDIYTGALKDYSPSPSNPKKLEKTDILKYILSNSMVIPKLSPRIYDDQGTGFDTNAAATRLSDPAASAVHPQAAASLQVLSSGGAAQGGAAAGPAAGGSKAVGVYQASLDPRDLPPSVSDCASRAPYFHLPGTEEEVKEVSVWLVGDLGTKAGRSLLLDGVVFLSASKGIQHSAARIAFFDSSDLSAGGPPSLLARTVHATLALPTRRGKIPPFLAKLLKDDALAESLASVRTDGPSSAGLRAQVLAAVAEAGLNVKDFESLLDEASTAAGPASCSSGVAKWLGVGLEGPEGGRLACAMVVNGRVVLGCMEGEAGAALGLGNLDRGDILLSVDYALRRQLSAHVAKVVRDSAFRRGHTDEEAAGGAGDVGSDAESDGGADFVAPVSDLSDRVMRVVSVLTAKGAHPIAMEGTALTASGFGAALGRRSQQISNIFRGDEYPTMIVHVAPPASLSSSAAPIRVDAVLDPLSKDAQAMAAVLLVLNKQLGCSVRLLLVPKTDLTEMPLKHFYRYVMPQASPAPLAASFASLPAQRVLTVGVDVPEPWLVEPVQADKDLDNLVMGELGPRGRMSVIFELEALLIQGSCVNHGARSQAQFHPRGLRLQLKQPGAAAPSANTLVMSNLGYFQLQAAPGRHTLGLAPGRSRELYFMSGASDLGEPYKPGEALGWIRSGAELPVQSSITVSSFQGKWLQLRIAHRPGKEGEDVLGGDESESADTDSLSFLASMRAKAKALTDTDKDKDKDKDSKPAAKKGGFFSRLKGLGAGGGGGGDAAAGDSTEVAGPQKTIHIFTIASGALYERLQRIMFLSVVRQTNARVKFWIIKNYMSPDWKRILPQMADHFGFDYELVTYKWPTWLNPQHEKQRIIWAYKILFLDVIFPLELDKVIFVDSDQVVRTDMLELMEMDIGGAPLAYTPFCDNNKDVEGYRFWKQGFWKTHLRGRPYHISALYVVDLRKFRRMAAGDSLRVLYDGLSRDRNSLSNLDQDLPNYAQQEVPIFSLPQEWLWCESWCGNATKARAKTIDLCNNPMSKEPKISMARRIIQEWPELDRIQGDFVAELRPKLAAVDQAAGQGGSGAGARAGQATAAQKAQKGEGSGHDGGEL